MHINRYVPLFRRSLYPKTSFLSKFNASFTLTFTADCLRDSFFMRPVCIKTIDDDIDFGKFRMDVLCSGVVVRVHGSVAQHSALAPLELPT